MLGKRPNAGNPSQEENDMKRVKREDKNNDGLSDGDEDEEYDEEDEEDADLFKNATPAPSVPVKTQKSVSPLTAAAPT
jgi:hypothetical protein